MQEPWQIGLAVAALILLWLLWQAVENTLIAGILAWIFGPVHNWWKARQSRKQP